MKEEGGKESYRSSNGKKTRRKKEMKDRVETRKIQVKVLSVGLQGEVFSAKIKKTRSSPELKLNSK